MAPWSTTSTATARCSSTGNASQHHPRHRKRAGELARRLARAPDDGAPEPVGGQHPAGQAEQRAAGGLRPGGHRGGGSDVRDAQDPRSARVPGARIRIRGPSDGGLGHLRVRSADPGARDGPQAGILGHGECEPGPGAGAGEHGGVGSAAAGAGQGGGVRGCQVGARVLPGGRPGPGAPRPAVHGARPRRPPRHGGPGAAPARAPRVVRSRAPQLLPVLGRRSPFPRPHPLRGRPPALPLTIPLPALSASIAPYRPVASVSSTGCIQVLSRHEIVSALWSMPPCAK